MKKKRIFTLIIFIFILIFGGVYLLYFFRSAPEEVRVNPKVNLNPEATYQVSFWLYPLNAGLSPGKERLSLEEELKGWLEGWQKKNARLQVQTRVLDLATGEWDLKERIWDQQPPDLYLFLEKVPCTRMLIPSELYLNQEDYQEWALQGSLMGQKIVSWPVAGWPTGFYIGNKSYELLSLPELYQEQGLVTLDYLLSEEGLAEGVQLLLPLKELFYIQAHDLLQSFITDYQLGEEEMRRFQALARKYKQYFNSRKKLRDEGVIGSLLEDEKGIIGPVNPWLMQALEKQMKDKRLKGYFLLLTTDNENPENQAGSFPIYIKIYGLSQFYQYPYQGDEHSKAAAMASEFLSDKLSDWMAENLSTLRPKIHSIDPGKQTGSIYQLTGISPFLMNHPLWEDILLPGLKQYWEGNIDLEELQKAWEKAAEKLKDSS